MNIPRAAALLFATITPMLAAAQAGGPDTPGGKGPPVLSAGNGPADASVATSRNYAEIMAGTANSKASLSVATNYAPPEGSGLLPAFSTLSATVSAPLGSGGNTQVATLDGLVDSTNATLKIVGFWVSTRSYSQEETAHYCGVFRKAADAAEEAKRPDAIDRQTCKAPNGLIKSCGTGSKACCNPQNVDLLGCMGMMNAVDVHAYNSRFQGSPATWAAGVSLSVGTKSYDFLNVATGASAKEVRTPWSVQVFGAVQWYQSLITAGVRYQVSYKEATDGALCLEATSYPAHCNTGPIGPPSRTGSPVPYLEYRQKIGAGLAIDPSINYDTRKSVVGINIPIYFVGDGSGKLTGGATVGWRSDEGGAQFGLFVGSAFSLGPQ